MVFSSKEFASELRASLGKLHFRGHSKATEDCRRPRGGTRNLHDGGSDVFFWVEHLDSRYFFGSRNTPGIFLGWQISKRFFSLFDRINQYFFWVGNFHARYFFRCQISGSVFSWVRNMKLRRTPPRQVYWEYPPWGRRSRYSALDMLQNDGGRLDRRKWM